MNPNAPIAIIGMSCRFAGDVNSPDKLWDLLAEGRSAWSEIPEDRFNIKGFHHPNFEKLNGTNVNGGHFLKEDIGLFDAHFFGLSAEAAATLDPQFRLQLESTYEALESAGITLQDVAGSNTSVFAGSFFRDYHESLIRDPDALPRFLLIGTGAAMASNRLSHFFDLRGPSMSLDTGCSTTLTALHQGCQSLRTGESDMSIVGGANVMVNPDMFLAMSSLTLISKDGRSYSFDDRANGYGRGEGSATVILKRLDDALRDGDPIRAVIRETGVNQDGKTETITTPSGEAQEALIRECYRKARLDPSHTTYFEAHGTGTITGDPIEVRAVASVFKDSREHNDPLRIGSIKTNIGHTEATSGVAAVIKVALALEKGQIPPSINFENPNKGLELDSWRLKVPIGLEPWLAKEGIRRASVNNFGYGGTNAHVIMEDYDSFISSQSSSQGRVSDLVENGHCYISDRTNAHLRRNSSVEEDKPRRRIFMLSAKDKLASQTMVSNLKDYLLGVATKDEDGFLDNLAHTLGSRRSTFPWLSTFSGESISDLVKTLGSAEIQPVKTGNKPRLGFVYTGQAAQWWAMGRELIDVYPVFRATLLDCDKHLKKLGATWNMIEELNRDASTTKVNELDYSTPVCVALQIALTNLLQTWGITPTAVTSHSSGEIAAACAVGALDLASAMAIAFARGGLASESNRQIACKGGMAAVGLGSEASQQYLSRVTNGKVVLACENSPKSITVSGDISGLDQLEEILKPENIFFKRLKVNAAWHSHHMEAVAGAYYAAMDKKVQPVESQADFVFSSPSTGVRMSNVAEIGSPAHWVRSLTGPVLFVDAFTNMCFNGPDSDRAVDMVIEVGPHAALQGPLREIMGIPRFNGHRIPYGSCLIRNKNAVGTMHSLVGSLLQEGYPVNITSVNFPCGREGVRVLHDLPKYPWNHQTRHWIEPRHNKALRSRQEAPHDLLGSLVLGTDLSAPSWRNVIRVSDIPWIRDHVVQGNIIYPAAGYISMVIEGMAQQALRKGVSEMVLGYTLRDIDITNALLVPETSEGIELQLSLRPCSEKMLDVRGWTEFKAQSVTSDNRWTDHCRGLVFLELSSGNGGASQFQHASHGTGPKHHQLTHSDSEYRSHISPNDVYSALCSGGICHGPAFQNLKHIRARGKESVTSFVVADSAATMPKKHQHRHVVHPTTLDSVFQAAYTAAPTTEGSARGQGPKIPKSIGKLWIAQALGHKPGHLFKAYTRLSHFDDQSMTTTLTVVDGTPEVAMPVMAIEDFIYQSIGGPAAPQDASWKQDKFAIPQWVPDITFLKDAYLKDQLRSQIPGTEAEALMELRQACLFYIYGALAQLTAADITALERHHKKFYIWMKLQVELARNNELAPNSSEWPSVARKERLRLLERVRVNSTNGEMVCRLGPLIVSVLRGEISAIEAMLKDELLNRYYLEGLKWGRSNAKLAELVGLYARKNPRAKMIEIGAGTGGATSHILKALGNSKEGNGQGPNVASYDFTDVSSGFFGKAKEKFHEWEDVVHYKKLDIERDPAGQGFEEGTYDVVIACQVLHATRSMENTMTNVRKLLKPGGKLFLMETTKDPVDLQFVFGFLEGWWLSEEEERKYSPSLTVPMWDRVLHRTGFSGIEAEVRDCDDDDLYAFSIMSSTVAAPSPKFGFDIAFVTATPSTPTSLLDQLRVSIGLLTWSVPTLHTLDMIPTDDNEICIFIDDPDSPILASADTVEFEALKSLCTRSRGLLWLTHGGTAECEKPLASLAAGFLRSIRQEYSGKRLATLDLNPPSNLWSSETVATITEVFRSVFDYSAVEHRMSDYEFAEIGGVVHVPRYIKDVARNQDVFGQSASEAVPVLEPFMQPDRPLRLTIGTTGLLETLAFDDDETALDPLPDDFVEIEPRAFGVNFRDVMVAMGQLKSQTMGYDCAGVIRRVGPIAELNGYKAGDRVSVLLRGHYGSQARVHWASAVHIPEDMTFETAASLPTQYVAAYVSLYDNARLQKGETVLIHSATGGVGQAAVMLAQSVGAEVFVTVGSEEKRNFVMEHFNIPSDHIFSSRDTSFASGIMNMTNGRGVDVVLNSLAGTLLQQSFNCLAPFGRFVEIGKKDLELNNSLAMEAFSRAVSFSSVDVVALGERKPLEANRILKHIIKLVSGRDIRPVQPVSIYPLAGVEKAFRLMQAGKHMGKIVLTISPDMLVPAVPRKPIARLHHDASYLVVGGFGGIGRSICHWLAEHGAQHVVVISRSAGSGGKADLLRTELTRAMGHDINVMGISCDISSMEDLSKALVRHARSSMPPIRGIIHGGMELRDAILEHMTLDDHNAALASKLRGSYNLHQYFDGEGDLDFFIMLSSLIGVVGFASQSNYSAGGAFQDALARHRALRGLPGVSLGLGIVKSVGYLAEEDKSAKTIDALQKHGFMALTESDVLAAVGSAITTPFAGAIALGLNTGPPGQIGEDSPLQCDSRFSWLRYQKTEARNQGGTLTTGASSTDLRSRISSAVTLDEAAQVIVEGIKKKLVDIFMIAEDDVNPSKSPADFGVDSLVAVELRNMLAMKAGADLSVLAIMQSTSITALAAAVAAKSSHISPSLLPG